MSVLPPMPNAPYEVAPFARLTDAQLHAIVMKHRLAIDEPPTPLPTNGVVHALWSLGSRYVLRVPKNEAMCIGDLRAEVAAIPVALASGVRTPALIAFSDERDIIDVPYIVVERVNGVDLSTFAPTDPALDELYRQLGHQLVALHSAPLPAPHPSFRNIERSDTEALLIDTFAAGLLGDRAVAWFGSLLEDLAHPDEETCFVHNDMKPDNLMVNELGKLVVIDWGDAGFADPATDFCALPLAAAAQTLDGYREAGGAADDDGLEQRFVRLAIGNAIYGLRRTAHTGPSWYRPLAANLSDLLMFATDQPEVWRRWINR